MLVVSDAGPLHYLILVGHADKLPVLYGTVAVLEDVRHELGE